MIYAPPLIGALNAVQHVRLQFQGMKVRSRELVNAKQDGCNPITHTDSVSGSDRVAMTYNRLGQMTTRTDQRGVVREFVYDKLGRLADDHVTTIATADGAIRKISRSYEVRGMIETITSYDAGDVARNQVKLVYNGFGQLTKESQDHAGAAGGSTPNVQYGYNAGASSSNQIRPTALVYPNGYEVASGGQERLSTRHSRRTRMPASPERAAESVAPFRPLPPLPLTLGGPIE